MVNNITAAALLHAARRTGISTLAVEPEAGWRHKILLASIVDVSNPEVRRQLVELNRRGEIILTRVDHECLIPADRRHVYEASRFWDLCSWFDSVAFNGEDLLFSEMVRVEMRGDRERIDRVRSALLATGYHCTDRDETSFYTDAAPVDVTRAARAARVSNLCFYLGN